MTAFTPIPGLINFVPLTPVLSADVNGNFAQIRNQFNNMVPSQNTIALDVLTENTLNAGVTVNKKFIVSGPSILVSGTTVSGIATFSSGFAISGGVVSGIATFSSGFGISGGVVSGLTVHSSGVSITAGALAFTTGASMTGVIGGVPTFASGINFAAGAAFVMGTTDNNTLAFQTNSLQRWTISAGGTLGPVTNLSVDFGASGTRVGNSYAAAMFASSFSFENTANTQLNSAATNINILVSGNLIAKCVATGGGIGVGQFAVSSRLLFNGADSVVLQSATLATGATVGYVYVPTTPGTVTGVPHTETGVVAMCVDTTNSRLQINIGGTWKTVLLSYGVGRAAHRDDGTRIDWVSRG